MCNVKRDVATYIADDSQLSECVENCEPDSDILTSFGDRPARFTGELVSVQADLKPVVEQCKQRRKRKRSHEDCYETELQHYKIHHTLLVSCAIKYNKCCNKINENIYFIFIAYTTEPAIK